MWQVEDLPLPAVMSACKPAMVSCNECTERLHQTQQSTTERSTKQGLVGVGSAAGGGCGFVCEMMMVEEQAPKQCHHGLFLLICLSQSWMKAQSKIGVIFFFNEFLKCLI